MPFLGKPPSDGNHNVLLDAITTSATATYNLTKDSVAYTPVSAQSLMVSLNGVTQAPIAAYTVSGSTIVFASALTSNDVIDYIIGFEGPRQTLSVDDIGAGQITSAMIADNAITSAKIGVDVIVAEDLAANSITVSELTDGAITEAKLNLNSPTNDHVLTADASATGGFKWAEPVSEGTQVKSTGESGGSKYLREDGDGTCSWQSVPAGVGGANGVSFDDAVEARWGDDNDLVIKESSGTAMITARSGGIIYLGAGSSGNMMNINNTQVNIIGECNLTNGNDLTVSGSGNIIIEEHATDATNGSLRFRERAANGSAYVGIKGPLDMGSDPSYTVTLPTATPTAGKALVANASTPTTLEWGDVSSTEANGTMYKNSFIISDAHTILATEGAHSVGPITVNNTVTVNGRWVIS